MNSLPRLQLLAQKQKLGWITLRESLELISLQKTYSRRFNPQLPKKVVKSNPRPVERPFWYRPLVGYGFSETEQDYVLNVDERDL